MPTTPQPVELWINDKNGLRCTYIGLRTLIREQHLPRYTTPTDHTPENASANPKGSRADHLGRKPPRHVNTATISRRRAGDPRPARDDSDQRRTGDGTADDTR